MAPKLWFISSNCYSGKDQNRPKLLTHLRNDLLAWPRTRIDDEIPLFEFHNSDFIWISHFGAMPLMALHRKVNKHLSVPKRINVGWSNFGVKVRMGMFLLFKFQVHPKFKFLIHCRPEVRKNNFQWTCVLLSSGFGSHQVLMIKANRQEKQIYQFFVLSSRADAFLRWPRNSNVFRCVEMNFKKFFNESYQICNISKTRASSAGWSIWIEKFTSCGIA